MGAHDGGDMTVRELIRALLEECDLDDEVVIGHPGFSSKLYSVERGMWHPHHYETFIRKGKEPIKGEVFVPAVELT